MTRDNVLFLVIGALVGFISGYVMHEAMAVHQPAPRRAVEGQTPAPGSGSVGGGTPQAGPGPAMEQVQQLRARVEQNPNDAQAVRQLANLNYDISNWDRAASLYQQYLELDPGNIDVMTDLGAVFRQLGQPQQALEQFRMARQLAPDNWQSLYNEVLVLGFDLADGPAAHEAVNRLVEMQPENTDVERLAAEVRKRFSNE